MTIDKHIPSALACTIFLLAFSNSSLAQSIKIKQDTKAKTVVSGNEKMSLTLQYKQSEHIRVKRQWRERHTGRFGHLFKNQGRSGLFHLAAGLKPNAEHFRKFSSLTGIHYGDKYLAVAETGT